MRPEIRATQDAMERHGYIAVTTLCAAMTALVAVLLTTHIVEPLPVEERV